MDTDKLHEIAEKYADERRVSRDYMTKWENRVEGYKCGFMDGAERLQSATQTLDQVIKVSEQLLNLLKESRTSLEAILESQVVKQAPFYNYSEAISNGKDTLDKLKKALE